MTGSGLSAVCWVPQAKFRETDLAIHLMIGVSGVEDRSIEVTLLPEMVILREGTADENDSQCRRQERGNSKDAIYRRSSRREHHPHCSAAGSPSSSNPALLHR
jgi:HSP20 family molecular chaperone IbpA